MAEQPNSLKKLVAIATDLELSGDLRINAIAQFGKMGTHAALVALLDIVANEALVWKDRIFALKQAERILKLTKGA